MKKMALLILLLVGSMSVLRAQWYLQPQGPNVFSMGLDFISRDTGYMCGQLGVYRTTNGAQSWVQVPLGTTNLDQGAYTAVQFQSALQGCAVGTTVAGSAQIVMTHDGGVTWSGFTFGTAADVAKELDFPTLTTGYVVASNGRMQKTTNGGFNWSSVTTGATSTLNCVEFVNAQVGFIGGDMTMRMTSNGGTSWTTVAGSWIDVTDIQFLDALNGYCVNDGNVYKTNDGGITWIQTAPETGAIGRIYFQSVDTGYALAGSYLGINITVDGGGYWSTQMSDSCPQLVTINMDFGDDTTGYICGIGGDFLKTTNAGGPYFYPQNDGGITSFFTTNTCADTQAVYAVIKNYGSDTLESLDINWSVNVLTQTPFVWTGSLLSGQSDTALISYHNFPLGTAAISGFSSLPNSLNDDRAWNDSTSSSLTFISCVPYDASVFALRNQVQICSGTNNISVMLKNTGDSILTSVFIHCVVDVTALAVYNWNGYLLPGDTTGLITLGTWNFVQSQTYQITTWTSSPNGFADSRPANDTLQASVATQGLRGVYTVGGSAPDYATLTLAAADLALQGICDTVILNIRSGTYNENVLVTHIPQASLYTPVYIQSEMRDSSLVTFSYNLSQPANATIQFKGVSFVTLRDVSVQHVTSGSCALLLSDSCSDISISNNYLVGYAAGGTNSVLLAANSNGPLTPTPMHNVLIQNNFIRYGAFGISFISSDSLNPFAGFVARNNRFEGQTNTALFLQYGISPVIDHNTFIGSDQDLNLLNLRFCKDDTRITSNYMSGLFERGVYYEDSWSHAGTECLIANNMIVSSPTSTFCYPLSLDRCSEVAVLNNSVRNLISGTYYIPFHIADGYNVRVLNNIFHNSGTGWAMRINDATFTSDYNNLYTAGPTLASIQFTPYSTLVSLQATFGNELNSISINTQFVSSTDLHILSSFSGVNDLGAPCAEVTDDIDRDVRSLITPDIGADEYSFFLARPVMDTGIHLNIYPNPAADFLNMELEYASRVVIINSLGQEVKYIRASVGSNQIYIGDLPPGIYIMNANSEEETFSTQFIHE